MPRVSYNRADLVFFQTALDAEVLGVQSFVGRQRVSESGKCGRQLAIELTADGAVVDNAELQATETFIVSKDRNTHIAVTFATVTDVNGRTKTGTYYDCQNKAKLVITESTGTLIW